MTLSTKRIAPGHQNTWFIKVWGTEFSCEYSTKNPKQIASLPYEAGGETFLVGALPTGSPDRFHLAVAPPEGRFRAVAEIRLGVELPATADALRFNPWNTGGGLRPSGLLNRWRRRAYPMSQAAWGVTREGGRAKQERAERVTGLVPSN